jgi:membrane fusion protein (multidrug efflux system)
MYSARTGAWGLSTEVTIMKVSTCWLLAAAVALLAHQSASAQVGASAPPAVGVISASLRSVTQQQQITGRVEATQRVDIVARVTAFMDERLFTEGAEVKAGDLLYRLERGPYEAAVEAARAAIDQAEATLENARLTLARQEKLLSGPAGLQSSFDQARASQGTAAGQLRAAKAQLRQAQINLDYTDIRSPIDGRIGRTAMTVGNLVGSASGALATVVSQDPMYVTFPIAVRRAIELRGTLMQQGFAALKIRLRLPDGRIYDHEGRIDFQDISVAHDTDTILLRGTIPNPVIAEEAGGLKTRELTNGEFVTVLLEDAAPVQLVAVPRSAVLSDQRGNYVYVVEDGNVARRRDLRLRPSTPQWAYVDSGLAVGDRVVVDGLQRVRPGTPVQPQPVSSELSAQPDDPRG